MTLQCADRHLLGQERRDLRVRHAALHGVVGAEGSSHADALITSPLFAEEAVLLPVLVLLVCELGILADGHAVGGDGHSQVPRMLCVRVVGVGLRTGVRVHRGNFRVHDGSHTLRLGEGGAVPADGLRATDQRHAEFGQHQARHLTHGVLIVLFDHEVTARGEQVGQGLNHITLLAVRDELPSGRVHAVEDRQAALCLGQRGGDATAHRVARRVPKAKLDLLHWLHRGLVEHRSDVPHLRIERSDLAQRGLAADAFGVVALVPSLLDPLLVVVLEVGVVGVQPFAQVVRVGEVRVQGLGVHKGDVLLVAQPRFLDVASTLRPCVRAGHDAEEPKLRPTATLDTLQRTCASLGRVHVLEGLLGPVVQFDLAVRCADRKLWPLRDGVVAGADVSHGRSTGLEVQPQREGLIPVDLGVEVLLAGLIAIVGNALLPDVPGHRGAGVDKATVRQDAVLIVPRTQHQGGRLIHQGDIADAIRAALIDAICLPVGDAHVLECVLHLLMGAVVLVLALVLNGGREDGPARTLKELRRQGVEVFESQSSEIGSPIVGAGGNDFGGWLASLATSDFTLSN